MPMPTLTDPVDDCVIGVSAPVLESIENTEMLSEPAFPTYR